MAGPAALLLVCAATVAVGITVASWGFSRRGSDAALAATMSGLAYLFLPVHLLGWLGLLTRASVAGSLAVVAVALVGGTLATASGRARWLETVGGIGNLMVTAVREPLRSRSVTIVGVVAIVGLCVWTAWLGYLLPSSCWDGLAYHEPMVALALQNDGFAWVGWGSGSGLLSQADGFPRLVENLMLVGAVAWDRRVVDMVPSALLPVVVLSVYALLRRFVPSRVLSLGLACAFALLPAIVLQLRSTMVDLAFVACCAAAFAWAVRRDPRPAEIWQLGIALGLLGASKVTGIFVLPFAIAIGVVSVVRGAGGSRRYAHLAGALLLCAAMTAPTYVRNVAVTGNPLWPARVDVLGVHLDGQLTLVDQNVELDEAVSRVSILPPTGQGDPGSRRGSYGYVLPLVIPPLALLGLWLALGRLRSGGALVLAVTLPLVAFFLISPARYWARLNLHVVLGAYVLAAYWLARRRHVAHAAVAILTVGSLAFLVYSQPHWMIGPSDLAALAAEPPTRRAVEPRGVGRLLPYDVAVARETELGAGDLVVVQHAGWFGLYWNERFDNRVEHLDPDRFEGDAWIAEAERRGAEWVVVPDDTHRSAALRHDPDWRWVGPSRRWYLHEAIFRRTPR